MWHLRTVRSARLRLDIKFICRAGPARNQPLLWLGWKRVCPEWIPIKSSRRNPQLVREWYAEVVRSRDAQIDRKLQRRSAWPGVEWTHRDRAGSREGSRVNSSRPHPLQRNMDVESCAPPPFLYLYLLHSFLLSDFCWFFPSIIFMSWSWNQEAHEGKVGLYCGHWICFCFAIACTSLVWLNVNLL